jgi:hypothetical protein
MEATPARDRKRDPHTCAGCGGRFDVTYLDDRADSVPTLHDVDCPRCGRGKSITLPLAAERTLQIEIDDAEVQADEGAGD